MSPELTPSGTSYDEQAASLLADIADRLLGSKKDWALLERIQRSLTPPKSSLTDPTGARTDTEIDFNDVMKKIYDRKISEEIYRGLPPSVSQEEYRRKREEEIRAKYSKPITTNTSNPTTMNGASYSYQWMDEVDKIRGITRGYDGSTG